MAEVLFKYKGIEIKVVCNINDKMEDIINKYITTFIKDKYFIYNGERIKKDKAFIDQINEEDKHKKKMNIFVFDEDNAKEQFLKPKYIVCPECEEDLKIKIEDYRLNLKCRNKHIRMDLQLDEYEDYKNFF